MLSFDDPRWRQSWVVMGVLMTLASRRWRALQSRSATPSARLGAVYCTPKHRLCKHHAPIALAPLVIRWVQTR